MPTFGNVFLWGHPSLVNPGYNFRLRVAQGGRFRPFETYAENRQYMADTEGASFIGPSRSTVAWPFRRQGAPLL